MPTQPSETARRAFDDAAGLMRMGAFDKAVGLLKTALQDRPNDPNLLHLYGASLFRLKQFPESEKALTHAVRLMPEFAKAHEALADILLQTGRVDGAVQSLRSAVKHDPTSSRARQKLSELLALLGRGDEADESFRQLLNNDPARNALSRAIELSRNGENSKAETIYRDALRRDPDNVDAMRLMGVLCAKEERFNDAEAFFRRTVELAPDYWKAWINLGSAQNEQQKFDLAEQAYLHALELRPTSVHTLEKLGANCLNDGRLEQAISWLEKALAIDPAHCPSLLCLGHALKTVGRNQDAIDAYRRCASVKPDFGEVFWSLANLKTFRFQDSEVEEMERQLDRAPATDAGEDSAISFCFALGKAFEDRASYRKAFEYYQRGNARKRLKVGYDPIEFQRTNDRIIEVFTADFFAQHAGQGSADDSPILIVGMPRSGSTLLEQILASHSLVEGTAELHYLLRLATETGLNRADGIKYPECMLELEPHHIEGLGREYAENTMKHRTGARYFTDKMPNNFTAIGFLHTILPNAKVIDARRHPLDSCLGTFKQLFARGQVFSYDFYDLAHYYTEYVRMMNHWHRVLPGKVLTVNYENVVADLETQVKRVAEHCGLAAEERMLRYHESKRAVKTASSEQVRQPIYADSVYLWRRFEDSLDELIDYLEPVLVDLPIEQQPLSLMNRNAS